MPRRRTALAVLLLSLALVRIASTFRVFSETTDESVHVATGLHLLTQHRYGIQLENPPIIPIVLATPLLLAGLRVPPDGAFFPMLHCVFYGLPNYKDALFLARVGNLLFFAIAAVAVWMWARRELGDRAALIALLLFTTEPIVLGYSGLATHDAGAMAGVAVSMLALSRWLERRTWTRAAVMGATYGFAILLKFSCIPFVGAAWFVTLLVRFARERSVRGISTLLIIPIVTALVTWAGYGFSFGSSKWIANGATIPAANFWIGLVSLMKINRQGMGAYAFGRISQTGWWWYFPVAIALKTSLPLLAMILAAVMRARRAALEAALAGAAIVAIGMSANLDLGIRYVLAAYVCWIFTAASFVDRLLEQRRGVAIALLSLQVVISGFAHPDYFPYFNAIAGRDPSRYLADSNLDWGQDVLRLRSVLRREKITSFGAIIFGTADLDALGFPKRFDLNPTYPTAGWIAISDQAYVVSRAQGGAEWLTGRPYRRVGKSIRLYHID